MARSSAKRLIGTIVAAFILQSAIPLGYMPSSIADGIFVELCPDGLSANFVAAITGDHHAHHADDGSAFEQCEVGQSIQPAAASADFAHTIQKLALASESYPATEAVFVRLHGNQYRPRAPPISLVI